MKKYIKIKKFRLVYAKNLQLAAVAIAGLAIAMSCSAQSECPPSITFSATLTGCSSASVSAVCTGDNDGDTVTETSTATPLGLDAENDDSCPILYFGDDPATVITLATGLNKLKANSEQVGDSSEIDITSSGANGPTVVIKTEWTDSLPSPSLLPCGLRVLFSYSCFTKNEPYWWGEDVAVTDTCPSCYNVYNGGGGFVTDNSGNYSSTFDSASIPCPSPTATNCTCTAVQSWHVDDLGNSHTPFTANIVTGTTIREKHTAPNVSTVGFTSL